MSLIEPPKQMLVNATSGFPLFQNGQYGLASTSAFDIYASGY